MFLCFINYSTLTTDQRIQATLMQNLFENVHTVREEEATWSVRLPCAFFQSLPSGILSVKKGVGRQHTTLPHAKMLLVAIFFFLFLWRVDYALEENVLTDQMWFLPLISDWEVVTRIFSDFLRSLFLVGMICPLMQEHFVFDLFWNIKFFIAAN